MMRSMYSGISGIRVHQTKMDVLANNISNVNTVGFKASRVTFQEVLSQTIQPTFGGSDTDDGMGGINAQQVGLGVSIGAIDVLHTPSGVQRTDRSLDVSISGDGFFRVSNGGETLYTRAGNFYLDKEGYLVTQNGYKVLDTNDAVIQVGSGSNYSDISINAKGQLTGTDAEGNKAEIAVISVAVFTNPQGLLKDGNNLFRVSQNSGEAVPGQPGTAGTDGKLISSLIPGYLEMSNVDLSQEFTDMIIAQRGFQANARVITTSNELLQELAGIIR